MGTRFHDYAISNDYATHFDGVIGEILLYNAYFDQIDAQKVYNYLNDKYNQTWTYPTGSLAKNGCILFEDYDYEPNSENQFLTSAYPNPFTGKTDFSLILDSKQSVKIELFNSYGEKAASIFDGSLPMGINDFSIDGTGLLPGMYLIKATGDGFTLNSKVILVK